jgi:hypothetical protein
MPIELISERAPELEPGERLTFTDGAGTVDDNERLLDANGLWLVSVRSGPGSRLTFVAEKCR